MLNGYLVAYEMAMENLKQKGKMIIEIVEIINNSAALDYLRYLLEIEKDYHDNRMYCKEIAYRQFNNKDNSLYIELRSRSDIINAYYLKNGNVLAKI